MDLRIRAEYPATDGGMPESVEVEWTAMEPGGADADLAQTVLGMLLRASAARANATTVRVGVDRGFVAGEAIAIRDSVSYGPDLLTVYRSGSVKGYVPAGVAVESVLPGDRMAHRIGSDGGMVWTKVKETK